MVEQLPDIVIKKAADGDEAAFSRIVSTYQKPVYNLALSILRDPEEAFDASQDAFLKIFRALPSFRFDCLFSSWLYRITRNTALDHVRRRNRTAHESLEEKGEFGYEPASDDSRDPFLETVRSERKRMLLEAIDALSDSHREVILLSAFAGASYQEIADLLGIEIGTVKSRISRAKNELKKILETRNFF